MTTTMPPDDPPPVAPEPTPEPATTTPSPAALLEGESPIYWLVPGRSGAPRCVAFVASPYTTPQGAGSLEPTQPQTIVSQRTTHLPNGQVSAPERPDPYRRIRFEFRREHDTLTLHTPQGMLSLQWAVLSSCSSTHELSKLPWFATEQACESARDQVPPMDFGDCVEVVCQRATVQRDSQRQGCSEAPPPQVMSDATWSRQVLEE